MISARSSPGMVWSSSTCTSSGRAEESPWMYNSSVSRPMGSMKSWCRGLSGKRVILASIEGQYRGPTPSMTPLCMGERSRFSRMIRWVSSLV